MKRLSLILTLIMACSILQAQEKSKEKQSFSEILVEAGEGVINLQTKEIEGFTKGVKVTLAAEDSVEESIVITSKTMTILTKEGTSDTSGFVMKGDVKLKHPKFATSSDQLEWNRSEGTLFFSGNVVADFGRESPTRATTIKYDLATGRAIFTDMRVGLPVNE